MYCLESGEYCHSEASTFQVKTGASDFHIIYTPVILFDLERRKAYDGGSLQVGAASMKQRAGSADESEVAFVRVKSLVDHLHRTIQRHHSTPSFSTNGSYKGKLWIKIGVSLS